MEARDVNGVRMDDVGAFGIEIDGIIAVSIPYVVADKFPGLAPALLKATTEWAALRTAKWPKPTANQ